MKDGGAVKSFSLSTDLLCPNFAKNTHIHVMINGYFRHTHNPKNNELTYFFSVVSYAILYDSNSKGLFFCIFY